MTREMDSDSRRRRTGGSVFWERGGGHSRFIDFILASRWDIVNDLRSYRSEARGSRQGRMGLGHTHQTHSHKLKKYPGADRHDCLWSLRVWSIFAAMQRLARTGNTETGEARRHCTRLRQHVKTVARKAARNLRLIYDTKTPTQLLALNVSRNAVRRRQSRKSLQNDCPYVHLTFEGQ